MGGRPGASTNSSLEEAFGEDQGPSSRGIGGKMRLVPSQVLSVCVRHHQQKFIAYLSRFEKEAL